MLVYLGNEDRSLVATQDSFQYSSASPTSTSTGICFALRLPWCLKKTDDNGNFIQSGKVKKKAPNLLIERALMLFI